MKYDFFWRVAFIFLLVFACSFSIEQGFLFDVGAKTSVFFVWQARAVAENILGWQSGTYIEMLISDSALFYLHAGLILLFSILLAGVVRWTAPRVWFVIFARYYLVMHLLAYGFSKFFKVQFYLPEPNTLYLRLGEVPQDLLFWSMMGASRNYTIFGGIMELLAAAALLFHRTRLAGAVLAVAVFGQVFAINLCFNISVKLLSGYFLLLALLIVVADASRAMVFFFDTAAPIPQTSERWQPLQLLQKSYYKSYILAKIILLSVLLANGLYPYWLSGNYDDDAQARPPLHGAYLVTKFVADGDTLPALRGDSLRWSRVFVHRRDYFIVEMCDEGQRDYELVIDTTAQYFALQNQQLKADANYVFLDYQLADSLIYLSGDWAGQTVWVELTPLPYRDLPILQPEFSWTIDIYR
jgi:hypothetical protein